MQSGRAETPPREQACAVGHGGHQLCVAVGHLRHRGSCAVSVNHTPNFKARVQEKQVKWLPVIYIDYMFR